MLLCRRLWQPDRAVQSRHADQLSHGRRLVSVLVPESMAVPQILLPFPTSLAALTESDDPFIGNERCNVRGREQRARRSLGRRPRMVVRELADYRRNTFGWHCGRGYESFCAPETLMNNGTSDDELDVYSLGGANTEHLGNCRRPAHK